MRLLLLLPLALFVGLAGLLLFRLYAGDPSIIPSALIGREVPQFELPPLDGLESDGRQVPGFASGDLKGNGVTLVNVWASWCVPCREEHPLLSELARDDRFRLFGMNYKDGADNARRFLGRYGNPFEAVGADANGRVGIDWGVYGVPETFIVDDDGAIVYKHIGPLTPQSISERLMPEIEKALAPKPAS
ncbi:DsbE family thiol:disulfide interchange protein [Microbaculum marinum]|uniref:DsbE family thiol:disulfide interchange protein n=2 Tax=Microbaculum marinum TaxID=1764581 RepID=A0AAW9RZB7_9HYPH